MLRVSLDVQKITWWWSQHSGLMVKNNRPYVKYGNIRSSGMDGKTDTDMEDGEVHGG